LVPGLQTTGVNVTKHSETTTADALTTMDYRMAAEAIADALARPLNPERREAMTIAQQRLAHAETLLRNGAIAGPVIPLAPHVLNEATAALQHAIESPTNHEYQVEALAAMRRALEAHGCIVLAAWTRIGKSS
jgi:hypothetical protein